MEVAAQELARLRALHRSYDVLWQDPDVPTYLGGRRVTLVSRHLVDGTWLTYTAWDTKEADLA